MNDKLTTLYSVLKVQDDGFEIVVNGGSNRGIKVGDRFLVYAVGEELLDPDTGENLGALEVVRGRGIATHVQEKLTTVRSTEHGTAGGSTKRIIKDSGGLGSMAWYLGAKTIEEIIPADSDPLPFNDALVGDKAKKI